MNLSILILTHNRPELFKRCLLSVLRDIPKDVKVLVNNDSCDIVEILHPQVEYMYHNNSDLSQLYKHLFDSADSEYVYFLEDDDVLLKAFYQNVNEDYDLHYMNYLPANVCDLRFGEFVMEEVNDLFQLSQIVFRKRLLTDFPTGNYRDNDWYLFQNVLSNSDSINIVNNRVFKQTTDGNDNISFGDYKWKLNPKGNE